MTSQLNVLLRHNPMSFLEATSALISSHIIPFSSSSFATLLLISVVTSQSQSVPRGPPGPASPCGPSSPLKPRMRLVSVGGSLASKWGQPSTLRWHSSRGWFVARWSVACWSVAISSKSVAIKTLQVTICILKKSQLFFMLLISKVFVILYTLQNFKIFF